MPTWFNSYIHLFKFRFLSAKPQLLMYAATQIMMPMGFIIGIGLIVPGMDSNTARNLITGNPILILLLIGLVMVPQEVGYARIQGIFDYMWSLPVRRIIFIAVEGSLYLVLTIPGLILSLVIGSIFFDFTLHINPLIIPALLLISASSTFIGYAIAIWVSRPQMIGAVSFILYYLIIIFSPINYPVENLPGWLAAIHKVLPVLYMADLSRGTLTEANVNLGLAFAVTGAWGLAAFIFTYVIISRRK